MNFYYRLQRHFDFTDDARVILRYGFAVAAGGLATLLRYALTPFWGNDFPYVFAYPATLLVALLAGHLPGMICLLLCAAGVSYFVPALDSPAGMLGQFLYLISNGMAVSVAGAHRAAMRNLRLTASYARSLFEASLDPLLTISTEGHITDINRAMIRATGVPRDKLIGSDVTAYFTEPDKMRAGYLTALEAGTVTDYPLTLRGTSGKAVEVLCNASIYTDDSGKTAGVLAAAHDITERKAAEDKISALNRELTQRVAALEQANKELASFSYSVSHDLRTPLRAIDGFIAILLEEHKDQIAEEGLLRLEGVRSNIARMGRLIDGLLEFTGLSNREMQLAAVDMTALACDVSREVLEGTAHRKINARVNALPPAFADAVAIRRLLYNLLHNAVKFTAGREDAQIEVGATAGESETIYYVRDNGVGFDMQYIDKLFGVFLRLHSLDEFEGAGVGLAIVKRIVERHGGRVWANGKTDEGATFYFALPNRD